MKNASASHVIVILSASQETDVCRLRAEERTNVSQCDSISTEGGGLSNIHCVSWLYSDGDKLWSTMV